MIFTKEELTPRIRRLALRRLVKILAGLAPEDVHGLDPETVAYRLLNEAAFPVMMAKMARRLWARGHDIEGISCPRVGYRLTHGPLVG